MYLTKCNLQCGITQPILRLFWPICVHPKQRISFRRTKRVISSPSSDASGIVRAPQVQSEEKKQSMRLSNLFDHFAHYHFYYAMIMRVKSIVKTPISKERSKGSKGGRRIISRFRTRVLRWSRGNPSFTPLITGHKIQLTPRLRADKTVVC